MKGFFKFVFSKTIIIVVFLACSFLLGFFVCNIINNNNAYYTATFTTENNVTFDTDKLVNEDYLISIRDNDAKQRFTNTDVSKMLKNNGFYVEYSNNEYTIHTTYKYYDKFFLNSSKTISTRAKTFIQEAVKGIGIKVTFKDSKNIVTLNNYINQYYFGLYFLLGGIVIEAIIFSILYALMSKGKIHLTENDFTYDNINFFKTCFHKNYWEFPIKKIKDITMISMLFAIMISCKFIPLPSGFGDLGLSFTYLFFAMIGLLYGPLVGFTIGIFSDIIGFFINSTGIFNIGYTLQAALTGAIYGLCFYKTKVNFSKVLLSRVLINFLMNVLLGSFLYTTTFCESAWFSEEFNDFLKSYLLIFSLPKNIFYLLPQSLLLFAIFKLTFPIFRKNKLISDKVYKQLNTF